MRTIGTREAKDIITHNDGIRIEDAVCRACSTGYKIYQRGNLVFKTSKINLALDWMVENGYLYETRIRLTAYQKNLLRERFWEYVGTTIMITIALSIALSITVGIMLAWLTGY